MFKMLRMDLRRLFKGRRFKIILLVTAERLKLLRSWEHRCNKFPADERRER